MLAEPNLVKVKLLYKDFQSYPPNQKFILILDVIKLLDLGPATRTALVLVDWCPASFRSLV